MIPVLVGTLLINIGVTVAERRYGKKLNSQLLIADASHTLSDIFVSIAVLSSVFLVDMGYPKADAYVGILVIGFIGWIAFGIVSRGVDILSDSIGIPPEEIRKIAAGIDGVHQVGDIRSRGFADSVFVDLSIAVADELSIAKAHDIAHRVEDALKNAFPQVTDVVVHVEPRKDTSR